MANLAVDALNDVQGPCGARPDGAHQTAAVGAVVESRLGEEKRALRAVEQVHDCRRKDIVVEKWRRKDGAVRGSEAMH